MRLEEEGELQHHDHNELLELGQLCRRLRLVLERLAGQGRHVHRRLGGLVRLHEQLRPDRRVPGQRLGPLLEPDAACRSWATSISPGAAGNETVGDLATEAPKPTDNGLTYTYKLRSGVKFGPPVNRAVTSKDVAYAMNRLANPNDGGQYSFYYTVIKGWDAVANGKAKTVSGIETPDDSTIVFHLTKADGRLQPPHVDAGDGTDPGGGRQVLRREARRLRP